MIDGFYRWSEANLGQWHYALGYAITLLSHNWPIILALVLALVLSVQLYRRPTRPRACWLFTALLFGLAYEYEKHVAVELHRAVDFLFGPQQGDWNSRLHTLIGPVMNTVLMLCFLALLAESVRTSVQARRAEREQTARLTPTTPGPHRP